MLIKEYRIVLPISVEEYQVGQLYAVAEASKNETGGGEGVEVKVNEPYEENGKKGQYTHKIYHLQSKVPGIIRVLAPKGALEVHEKAWNEYPYCKTILTNDYMKENFMIKIETWHKKDLGTEENVHGLEKSLWDNTEIVDIDIAAPVPPKEHNAEFDPTAFKSQKTGRGPLGANWKEELAKQVAESGEKCDLKYMCAYKLVTAEFKWKGFQGKVEGFIHKMEKRLFTHFHRQLFCWIDNWCDLTIEDIRRMEEETQQELDEMRKKGEVKGMGMGDK